MLKKRDLNGKVALITGASGGIGRAIAIRLAEDGMNLILCGRNEEKLLETARLTGREADMLVLPIDMNGSAAVEEVFEKAVNRFGGVDALINNAGLAQSTPFESIPEGEYDRIMLINTKIPFLMCQKALPLLRKSDVRIIINIGSVVSHNGYPLQSVYTASKHALIGFTKALAKEVYQEKIRVHMISPGGVYTDMIRIARPDLSSDGMIAPEEVAEAAAFLLESPGNGIIDEIQLHRIGKEPYL